MNDQHLDSSFLLNEMAATLENNDNSTYNYIRINIK